MKPIEINNVGSARPVHSRQAQPAAAHGAPAAPAGREGEQAMVSRSQEALAGPVPPVDAARVSEIRNAIREGRYPLTPTQVADAIVAANYLLTDSPKED